MKEKNKVDYVKDVVISLLGGYGVTVLGITILAFLLLLLRISENVVDIGIIVIYVLACLISGIVVGKRTKNKKFLWGMISGIIYFMILFFISVLSKQSIGDVGRDFFTTLLICTGSGMLGGMIS